jgi:hypothetical protein
LWSKQNMATNGYTFFEHTARLKWILLQVLICAMSVFVVLQNSVKNGYPTFFQHTRSSFGMVSFLLVRKTVWLIRICTVSFLRRIFEPSKFSRCCSKEISAAISRLISRCWDVCDVCDVRATARGWFVGLCRSFARLLNMALSTCLEICV